MKNRYLKNIKNWIYTTYIIIIILIVDIISKNWIIKNIKIHHTKKIFSILNFFHTHNYGIAFSLLSKTGKSQRWLLSIISIFTILIVTRIMIKSRKEKNIIAYSFIIAGAIGNLIDRIYYGFVIDFIDVHINNWHFAIFNIADCSIFFGVLSIIIRKNY